MIFFTHMLLAVTLIAVEQYLVVIHNKMTSKKSLLLSAAVAALCCCYSVNAFSASRRPTAAHHYCCRSKKARQQQTRLFISSSTATTSPSPVELEADIIINSSSSNDAVTTIPSHQQDIATTSASTSTTTTDDQLVPSTWSQALQHFFLKDIGPPLVLLTISGFIYTRLQLLSTAPFSITELAIFASSIVLWWVQEYFFHRVLLHSPFNWIGKSIHASHHEKTYFHISIDPPALLLGWLFTAHFLIKAAILPSPHQYHLCLIATIGYSLAGLIYEWSHYIVHTKVKPHVIPKTSPSYQNLSWVQRTIIQPIMISYAKMRDNHIRHHLIDDSYWYAFSFVEMDDLFGTNPNVKDVKREVRRRREGFQ